MTGFCEEVLFSKKKYFKTTYIVPTFAVISKFALISKQRRLTAGQLLTIFSAAHNIAFDSERAYVVCCAYDLITYSFFASQVIKLSQRLFRSLESIIARLAKCRVVDGFAPATVAEAVPIARAFLAGGLCSYVLVMVNSPATEVTLPCCGNCTHIT